MRTSYDPKPLPERPRPPQPRLPKFGSDAINLDGKTPEQLLATLNRLPRMAAETRGPGIPAMREYNLALRKKQEEIRKKLSEAGYNTENSGVSSSPFEMRPMSDAQRKSWESSPAGQKFLAQQNPSNPAPATPQTPSAPPNPSQSFLPTGTSEPTDSNTASADGNTPTAPAPPTTRPGSGTDFTGSPQTPSTPSQPVMEPPLPRPRPNAGPLTGTPEPNWKPGQDILWGDMMIAPDHPEYNEYASRLKAGEKPPGGMPLPPSPGQTSQSPQGAYFPDGTFSSPESLAKFTGAPPTRGKYDSRPVSSKQPRGVYDSSANKNGIGSSGVYNREPLTKRLITNADYHVSPLDKLDSLTQARDIHGNEIKTSDMLVGGGVKLQKPQRAEKKPDSGLQFRNVGGKVKIVGGDKAPSTTAKTEVRNGMLYSDFGGQLGGKMGLVAAPKPQNGMR